MGYKDKEKQARAAREHYEANKEVYKERARAHRLKVNALITAYIIEVKNVPCPDCGGKFEHYQMDFDHLPEFEKAFNISDARRRGKSLELVKTEIAKCEVVCANCHRKRSYERLQNLGNSGTL